MIGQDIAQYRILEQLGEGGMGVVYKAHDTKLDRTVALKFLPPSIQAGEQTGGRFLQEARAAAALNHPNVCSIHAVGEYEGRTFLDMEFVEGQTLRSLVGGTPQRVDAAAAMAIQIGEALQEAHSKGIVHRDIKSENIMVTPKGQVKVMDFGLAKLKGSLKLTRTSSTVGTLAYMAPEQISGGDVDARSDIFSFGVVLFEMLTAKTPFRGDHEAALVYSIVHEDPEPIEKLRPDLPAEFVHVVQRALEKNPDERYQSALDLVIDLRRALRQTSKLSTTQVPLPPRTSPTHTAAPHHPGVRTRPLLRAGFVALVLAAAATAVFLLRDTPPPAPALSMDSMRITRLTSTGKARAAAVSPDGKYVVYSQEESGRQSLWVRQVATGSTVQIVPPEEALYTGLTLSNDGNFVYYVVQTAAASSPSLYRIPVLGGTPRKIQDNVRNAVTMSPDGSRLAYTRAYAATGEFSLLVANTDGTGERVLASHKADRWFEGEPSWSPDGSTIACALGSWEGGMHFSVIGVNTTDGTEQPLAEKRWAVVAGVRWTDDGSGLLVQAWEGSGLSNFQIWQVSLRGGTVARLTNDLLTYRSISLTGDGRSLCVVQEDATANIWILRTGERSGGRQVTRGKDNGTGGVSWVSDDQFLYTSNEAGNLDIWLTDLGGSFKRQLTMDPGLDYEPSSSADGSFFLYTSSQSGIPNIWRRAIDGSAPKQLTDGGEDYRADIAPDGDWFVFDSWDSGPLLVMRAPTAGGTPARLSPQPGNSAALSPDGRRIAYCAFDDQSRKTTIHIMPASGGASETSFELPPLASRSIRWTPDGKSISYVETRNGVSNVWIQPLAGGSPVQVTDLHEHLIAAHDWSPGGQFLAVARYTSTSDVLLMTSEAP